VCVLVGVPIKGNILLELEDEHRAKEMCMKEIWEIKWGGI